MKLLFSYRKDTEKGVMLYFAVVVTLVMLGIGLGINSLLTTQLKTTRGSEESLQALYVADAGIERLRVIDRCMSFTGPRSESDRSNCLQVVLEVLVVADLPGECKGWGLGGSPAQKQDCRKVSFAGVIEATSNTVGGGEYSLCKDAADPADCNIQNPGVNCSGLEYCAKSTGSFQKTKRAVEVTK